MKVLSPFSSRMGCRSYPMFFIASFFAATLPLNAQQRTSNTPAVAGAVVTPSSHEADKSVPFYRISLNEQVKDFSKSAIPDSVQQWIDRKLHSAKTNTLTDYQSPDFFKHDTSLLIGYLKNYHPQPGLSNGMVHGENVLTFESVPVVIPIEPDGRFEVKIPLAHPVHSYIVFNDHPIYFYAEQRRSILHIQDLPFYAGACLGIRETWRRKNSGNTQD